MREKAGMHPEFYQRDVTDECGDRGTFCRRGVKELSGVGQNRAETRERSAACFWVDFPLICMEDVDYDALWRVSLNEVQQRRAHASSILVTECNGYSERMPL